jgi:hypothetical protein
MFLSRRPSPQNIDAFLAVLASCRFRTTPSAWPGRIFTVSLRPETGDVSYGIRAVSSPRAMLARLGYPLTRALQARSRRDSVLAMTRVLR